MASLRELLGSWQSHALYVILSETKDLKACTAIHRHGNLEILHSVQNDRGYSVIVSVYVILSATKDLLADNTLSTVIARLETSRGNLSQYVMLSNAKHLLAGYTLSMRVVAGRLRGDSSLRSE